MRFFLMRRALIRAAKKTKSGVQDLADIPDKEYSDKVLHAAFDEIFENYLELGSSDQVAKGADFEGIVNGLSL